MSEILSGCIVVPMDSEAYAVFIASLTPGTFWIDDMPEPLETVADVEELLRRVAVLKAKRPGIERASWN